MSIVMLEQAEVQVVQHGHIQPVRIQLGEFYVSTLVLCLKDGVLWLKRFRFGAGYLLCTHIWEGLVM